MRLGEMLMKRGLLAEDDLERALTGRCPAVLRRVRRGKRHQTVRIEAEALAVESIQGLDQQTRGNKKRHG